ncbi:MAG: hypothetical protein FJ014_05695 [Chloroflexi bacterium]|nr:hypothetical protein [Chloroflexota bacterium]
MYVEGVTHVAVDISSPTRTERFLRKVFGLQTLHQGYWKGEYILIMGSPDPALANPGFITLHLRPGIHRGRLNHVGIGVRGQGVQAAVDDLRRRGAYVDIDGDHMLYGPEELHVQLDSFTHPPCTDDPTIKMEDCPVDPHLPCMVRGISHVAVDVATPTRMMDWLRDAFGLDGKRVFARRGEFISVAYYEDAPKDPVGRKPSLFALFLRPGLPHLRLNHIAFDVADANGAISVIESKGVNVDLGGDAMIHGPEDLWYQLDSSTAPFPVGHPANDPGVRYSDRWR